MNNRGKKFYNKNEKEVLGRLGFKSTLASGAGWVEKEDGESDVALAQLKTTDAERFTITLKDMHTLEYHAALSRKIPIFINQCLTTDDIYVTVNVNDFPRLKKIILGEEFEATEVIVKSSKQPKAERVVKSSSRGRQQFFKERDEKWQKKRK